MSILEGVIDTFKRTAELVLSRVVGKFHISDNFSDVSRGGQKSSSARGGRADTHPQMAVEALVAAFAVALLSPTLMNTAPRSSSQHSVLILVTQGLEEVAAKYLTENRLISSVEILPQPRVALGEAAVGKLLAHASPSRDSLARLQQAPVVQAVLAYVAAAKLPQDNVIADVTELVGSSPHWSNAIELLAATGVRDVAAFRASGACSGRMHRGFGSEDVMRAMGAGVLSSTPAWTVDLYDYDVELFGALCDGHFACGLLLGGEWRTNANPKRRQYGVAPFTEGAGRPYLKGSRSPWYMPRLRPSTALLLLNLADIQPGHVVLDPFGGSGTLAIEAAVHVPRVHAISSDTDHRTSSAAIANMKLARDYGLADGSMLEAHDWDATDLTTLDSGSVDRIVTDLPFGHRCRWDVQAELPLFLAEATRVLRPGSGQAVLLMPGYQRVSMLLNTSSQSESGASGHLDGIDLVERRRVAIGGFGCWALTLVRNEQPLPISEAPKPQTSTPPPVLEPAMVTTTPGSSGDGGRQRSLEASLRAPTLAAQIKVCRAIAAAGDGRSACGSGGDRSGSGSSSDGGREGGGCGPIGGAKPLEERFEPAIYASLTEAKGGFADHSRFTARFGDVLALSLAHDAAAALSNTRALLRYLEQNASAPGGALAATLAAALTTPLAFEARHAAIVDRGERRSLATEGGLTRRLYHGACVAAAAPLRDVGLSEDWMGLTVLMAVARSQAGRGTAEWRHLESAVSGYFSAIQHGGAATYGGLSFLTTNNVGCGTGEGRKRVLVVAFASRGVGVARHEFGAAIDALATRGALSDCHVDSLLLADSADAWYTQDTEGKWRGAAEVEQALRAATRREDYHSVILLGDSMGGSACLRFARFADLAVAFSPQVRLRGDPHVGRRELRSRWRSATLEASIVGRAKASRLVCARGRLGGTEVLVHRGTGARDIANTRLLSSRVVEARAWRAAAGATDRSRSGVTVVQHKGCKSHLFASKLSRSGGMAGLLDLTIERHREARGWPAE